MQIIVLGGGIGGLAISALLARQGKDVILVEKNDFIDDHGAGIQISSNAQKVLYELGILDLFWKVADAPSLINIIIFVFEIDSLILLVAIAKALPIAVPLVLIKSKLISSIYLLRRV